MKHLFIINDQPYGSEKPYNALRLAMQVQRDNPSEKIWIFLMADAAACAIKDQKTPNGHYNIERMVTSILSAGGEFKICTSCADARGIIENTTIEGCKRSSMSELAKWYMSADKVTIF